MINSKDLLCFKDESGKNVLFRIPTGGKYPNSRQERRDGNGRSKAPASLPPVPHSIQICPLSSEKFPGMLFLSVIVFIWRAFCCPKANASNPLCEHGARLVSEPAGSTSRQESEKWGIGEKSLLSASTDQTFPQSPWSLSLNFKCFTLRNCLPAYLHTHQTHTYCTDSTEMTVSQKPKTPFNLKSTEVKHLKGRKTISTHCKQIFTAPWKNNKMMWRQLCQQGSWLVWQPDGCLLILLVEYLSASSVGRPRVNTSAQLISKNLL